jgi:biotin--protein ligase
MKLKITRRSTSFCYCFLLAVFLIAAMPISSRALQNAQIAIYDDSAFPDGGAWAEGLTAIRSMLNYYGYSYINLTPDELNQTENLYDFFQVIIFGGGWAGGYNTTVTEAGYNHIRTFVLSGGGYFGICAGAYFASDIVSWKPNMIVPRQTYDYPLNLFTGAGIGPVLGIAAWTEPTGCTTGITSGAAMTVVAMDSSGFPDIQTELPVLYFGGPVLVPGDKTNPAVQIIGRYQVPHKPANNTAAMILFPYGAGKVFLSGTHPEISFNVNNCTLYYDINTWEFMNRVILQLLSSQ